MWIRHPQFDEAIARPHCSFCVQERRRGCMCAVDFLRLRFELRRPLQVRLDVDALVECRNMFNRWRHLCTRQHQNPIHPVQKQHQREEKKGKGTNAFFHLITSVDAQVEVNVSGVSGGCHLRSCSTQMLAHGFVAACSLIDFPAIAPHSKAFQPAMGCNHCMEHWHLQLLEPLQH